MKNSALKLFIDYSSMKVSIILWENNFFYNFENFELFRGPPIFLGGRNSKIGLRAIVGQDLDYMSAKFRSDPLKIEGCETFFSCGDLWPAMFDPEVTGRIWHFVIL